MACTVKTSSPTSGDDSQVKPEIEGVSTEGGREIDRKREIQREGGDRNRGKGRHRQIKRNK